MTDIGATYNAACIVENVEAAPDEIGARAKVVDAFRQTADDEKLTFGLIRWSKRIDSSQGPVIVGEANVIGLEPEPPSLSKNLDRKDLKRLRLITRRAHHAYCPQQGRLSDEEVDAIIDQITPNVGRRAMRAAVDSGMVQ